MADSCLVPPPAQPLVPSTRRQFSYTHSYLPAALSVLNHSFSHISARAIFLLRWPWSLQPFPPALWCTWLTRPPRTSSMHLRTVRSHLGLAELALRGRATGGVPLASGMLQPIFNVPVRWPVAGRRAVRGSYGALKLLFLGSPRVLPGGTALSGAIQRCMRLHLGFHRSPGGSLCALSAT
jgi:hypothetical protein